MTSCFLPTIRILAQYRPQGAFWIHLSSEILLDLELTAGIFFPPKSLLFAKAFKTLHTAFPTPRQDS